MNGDLGLVISTVQAAMAESFTVFLRVGAAMALVPGFGEQTVPARVRLALAIGFTLIVAPAVHSVPVNPTLMLTEPAIGLIFGLGLRLMIVVLQVAGTIAAQSTSLSQMFAGAGAEPQPVVSHLLVLAGLAMAMGLGLHVRVAQAMIETYRLFPVGDLLPSEDLLDWAIGRIASSFTLAFGLAMPFVIAALIYNVALGAINRAMPQLMVAFVGAPALTAGGLLMLVAAMPVILKIWSDALNLALARPF